MCPISSLSIKPHAMGLDFLKLLIIIKKLIYSPAPQRVGLTGNNAKKQMLNN
jgi:hypothetical protein